MVFAVARYLSVRLSGCHVGGLYPHHTAEDIVKLLGRPGSPIILVFLTPSADTQFQGNSFSGGVKYTGWENLRFSTEIAVYLGNSTR